MTAPIGTTDIRQGSPGFTQDTSTPFMIRPSTKPSLPGLTRPERIWRDSPMRLLIPDNTNSLD